jgi:hypothetical protein
MAPPAKKKSKKGTGEPASKLLVPDNPPVVDLYDLSPDENDKIFNECVKAVPLPRSAAPFRCSVSLQRFFRHSPAHHATAPFRCAVFCGPFLFFVPLRSSAAPFCCAVPLRRSAAPFRCAVPLQRSPAAFRCSVSL